MNMKTLVEICKKYNNLGAAVQEQLDDAMNNRFDQCNPNAIKIVDGFLDDVGRLIESESRADVELVQSLLELQSDIEDYFADPDADEDEE